MSGSTNWSKNFYSEDSMSKTNFIGYATLEMLAEVMDVNRPVYASATQNPGKPTKQGIYTCRAEIAVEQPDDRGDVHYCALLLGRYTALIGVPDFDPNKPKVGARQEQVLALVNAWLHSRGFTTREAQISKPDNLRLLDGWFESLHYDKETNIYFLPGVVSVANNG